VALFFHRKKVICINNRLKGQMHVRHHTKDYIQPIYKLSIRSTTSKEEELKLLTLPKIKSLDENIFQALNRNFNSSKTLLFLSLSKYSKKWHEVEPRLPSSSSPYYPKSPPKLKKTILNGIRSNLRNTQATNCSIPKNPRKWSIDSESPLHMKHILTKVIPFFCRLS